MCNEDNIRNEVNDQGEIEEDGNIWIYIFPYVVLYWACFLDRILRDEVKLVSGRKLFREPKC